MCVCMCVCVLERFKVVILSRKNVVFTSRRYASAVYAVIVCVCVRLSVCLSQVGVLLSGVGYNQRLLTYVSLYLRNGAR